MKAVEIPVATIASDHQRYLTSLYEQCFPAVARFVSKRKGTLEDAKDIFHDALIIYHEKTIDDNFHVEISPEAYIVGISKNLWSRKFGESRRNVSMDEHAAAFSIPDGYHADVNENLLLRVLERAGKRCLSLLRLFYFEKASMEQVKDRFGYKSEHSATVQKYKCIEKIRETINEKSIRYEDFLN